MPTFPSPTSALVIGNRSVEWELDLSSAEDCTLLGSSRILCPVKRHRKLVCRGVRNGIARLG